MPFKSKAQQRFMFAAEERGELKSGTARRWAHHTKSIKKLPERVKKAAQKPSRWKGTVRESGGELSTAGLLGGTAIGTLMAAKDLKRGNLLGAGKRIAGAGGAGWFTGSLAGAAKGALKPKTSADIAAEAGARHFMKIAFGEREAGRILALFKKKKLPKAGYKAFAHPTLLPASVVKEQFAISGFQGGRGAARHAKRETDQMVKQLRAAGKSTEADALDRYGHSIRESFTKRVPGGAVLQRKPAGRLLGQVARAQGKKLPKLKTPQEKKMLEATVKGHEIAETQVKPSGAFRPFGHNSPDVILREHNIITTLPKKYKKVGETMRVLRGSPSAAIIQEGDIMRQATGGKLQFGKGQRLSRHGRKHVTRMMEKRMKELGHG